MNMRDVYPILHLDTNSNKVTVLLLLFFISVTVRTPWYGINKKIKMIKIKASFCRQKKISWKEADQPLELILFNVDPVCAKWSQTKRQKLALILIILIFLLIPYQGVKSINPTVTYWWRKPEYRKKITDLSQVTDKPVRKDMDVNEHKRRLSNITFTLI
jgi:hypothetical protein